MSKYIVKAKKYKVQDDDSIKSIADANQMTWQELAKFNWGTSEPNKINKFLRDKVGCRKKTRDGKNYMFTSKDDPGILYIPEDMDPKSFQASTENTLKVEIPNYNFKECTIKGIYAHKHLEDLAERLSEPYFIGLLIPIFGTDIPAEAYRKLYQDLSYKSFPPPEYQVMKENILDGQGIGHEAAYNRETQTIHIYQELVDNAISEEISSLQTDDSGKLFAALQEEYGHYIDDSLRNRLSKIGGDANRDEGAVFAYNISFFEKLEEPKIHFADVNHPSYNGPLNLDFTEAYNALQEYESPEEQLIDGKYKKWEFFGAMDGHEDEGEHHYYTHGTIERALIESGFSNLDILRIYFGNWLRDFSQIVDPKLVRPEPSRRGAAQAELNRCSSILNAMDRHRISNDSLTGRSLTYLNRALDSFRFSRKTLTSIVGFIAYDEFRRNREYAVKFKNLLIGSDGMEILGGYRPQEHIDNPMQGALNERPWMNNHLIDPFFPPPATDAQMALNPVTKIKNYIKTTTAGESFETSVSYMEGKLERAKNVRNTDEGFRCFGEGLHVLEDFFAHSNFVEISLIKLGFNVFPWVDSEIVNGRIPLVTGLFGSTDVIGSIAPKVAEKIPHNLDDYHHLQAGERTQKDELILLILFDLTTSQDADISQRNPLLKGLPNMHHILDLFNQYLTLRDMYCSGIKIVEPILFAIKVAIDAFLILQRKVYYFLARNAADMVDDFQTYAEMISHQRIGTNPSHTQLAKDDPDKPLHDLAGILAKEAVKRVGVEMYKCMYIGSAQGNPVPLASSFIVHPLDTNWMDDIVRNWARQNQDKITMAMDRTLMEQLSRQYETRILATLRRTEKELEEALEIFNNLYHLAERAISHFSIFN